MKNSRSRQEFAFTILSTSLSLQASCSGLQLRIEGADLVQETSLGPGCPAAHIVGHGPKEKLDVGRSRIRCSAVLIAIKSQLQTMERIVDGVTDLSRG